MIPANDRQREVWVDWLRVAACFMVMVVHSTEPFYLGGLGSRILTRTDELWAAFFDCFVRACVPLFIIASSYLQFPLHYSTGEFFRRRAVRVLVPFAIWTVVYAFWNGTPAENFKGLLLNFNYSAGHLWFVYMLIGIYIIMPLLSPWAEKVGRRELQVYLGIWALTLMVPLVRDWVATGSLKVVYGPLGLPQPARYPLWGEASWNIYGVFYYMSGFVGYLLLGLWFRKFAGQYSLRRTLLEALPCLLGGFAICFFGFIRRADISAAGVYPVEGPVDLAVWWETTWCNDTIGVALMSIGWILLFRRIKCSGWLYSHILLPVSKASYGMYLCHMIALGMYSALFRGLWGVGLDSCFGTWTRPLEIVLTAVCSFVTVAVFSVLVQKIPKVGKYIIG